MIARRLIRLLVILDGKTHKGGCAVTLLAGAAALTAAAAAVVGVAR